MSNTSSGPAVLIFADADDVGVSRLASHLASRLDVVWWRFGAPESSVSVFADDVGFRLEQPEVSLDSTALRNATVVIYRRRLLQPRPLVASGLDSPQDQEFSEREWTSLIDGLLLSEEGRALPVWMNSPSTTLLGANKLSLIMRAARAGLPVPRFSISTPVCFPESNSGELVTKAISANERIDVERYFSTAKLSATDLTDLPGARLPTPSLLQEYVAPEFEIRVFYAFGRLFSLALTPSRNHVDIRHAPRMEIAPTEYDLSPELRSSLDDFAKSQSFSYCTFDLVVPDGGEPLLVDITPNGDWDYFESDSKPVVSEFLAQAIVDRTARSES